MKTWRQLRYLLAMVPLLALGLVGSAQAAPRFFTTGNGQGSGIAPNALLHLVNVRNVTVEGLPDHKQIFPSLSNFQTNDQAYRCLNGETINVWVAPKEFPDDIVIHNGDQGSQCTYGTWVYRKATSSFTCTWNGGPIKLAHLPNVTIEGLSDVTLVGTCNNFQTNSTPYTCLDGENINVFTAPSEYPNEYVIHNGLMGSQCTYGVWVFAKAPNTYTGSR